MRGEDTRVAAAIAARAWQEDGHLSLRGLGLRALPAMLRDAAGLRSLDIGSNRLAELPPWLWELPHLERLVAAGNRLRQLDGAVSRLSVLRELDVSDNWLAGLPPELAACQDLRRLDVSGNAIEDLGAVARLPGLVVLDAARNRIGAIELPPSPVTLQALDLSGNQLKTLPGSFRAFRALRRLDLSGNRLTSPALAVLARLPLQELYLDDNQLTEPVDPAEWPELRRLSAAGNPVGQAPAGAEPDRWMLSERAAAAVARHLASVADPDRQYFTAPEPPSTVALSAGDPRDTRRVVDLYYKRFGDFPAKVAFGDGTSVDLSSLSRATALEFAARHHAPGTDARISLSSPRGADFLYQAIARLDSGRLVRPDGEALLEVSRDGLTPLARVLNVALTDSEHRALGQAAVLAPLREYAVRLNIGSVAEQSIIINPIPIRAEDLHADSTEGFWLDVVVASADVDVAADVFRLFLPFDGSSWVCGCAAREHTCRPEDREAYLYVPIRTRAGHGAATVRCTIYNDNNAVQSVRVKAAVGPPDSEPSMITGVIDFALADDVAQAAHLRPRQLNVLMNESPAGTQQLVVKNGDRAIAADITESSAQQALAAIRGKLTEITLGRDRGVSQYDDENRKQTDVFIRDLGQLARLGWVLYQGAVPGKEDRAYLREHLAARSTIQVARLTPAVFPWALIYDIPCEIFEPWSLCPLLGDWKSGREQLAGYPESCPYRAAHRANVLCPFGFWGFRHLLEQPPSVRHGALRTRIRVREPALAAVSRSLALNLKLTDTHFKDLEKCFAGRFELVPCDTKASVRKAFADPGLPIAYFYCHGRRLEIAGITAPFLEIGTGDRIAPADFAVWDEDDAWGPMHWAETAPLVFINGCETAKLSPEDVVTFVEALAGMDVAGVIGTEIPVIQQVAGEVALGFYRNFAGEPGASAGTALYRTRIDLLRKGNVAGLAYTPFCSADLSLQLSG